MISKQSMPKCTYQNAYKIIWFQSKTLKLMFWPFPAPGDYAPEKSTSILLDNAPKYTFGMRTECGKPVNTPGKNFFISSTPPKEYAVIQPHSWFSIFFPAPGDYAPEKSTSILLDNAPKYTFGMRTESGKPVDTPGKNFSSRLLPQKNNVKSLLITFMLFFNISSSAWRLRTRKVCQNFVG